MRRAFLSFLAVALAGCGSPANSGAVTVNGTVAAAGIQLTLEQATIRDNPLPYLEGPPGTHCAYYQLRVQAVDGQRHDLRPAAFSADGATPADAVARCGGPQLEPTWIDSDARTVTVAILERTLQPSPLSWRPD
jgi:hypothetical protein